MRAGGLVSLRDSRHFRSVGYYYAIVFSVEELQWSPTEATVYCSGSSDRSVRVWDVRGRTGPQLTLPDAHNEDVNVLSWNKTVTYLLASAADDGTFKVGYGFPSKTSLIVQIVNPPHPP